MYPLIGRGGYLILLGALLFLPSPPAWGQIASDNGAISPKSTAESAQGVTVHFTPETKKVDITARSAPLSTVLEVLTRETGVVFHLPKGMNPTITQSIKQRSLERAVHQLLGSPKNAAMIYVADPENPEQHILTEVTVLDAGGRGISGKTKSPPSSAASRSLTAPTTPRLSPEELAVRQAEKAAKRAEKMKAKEEKQAAKRSSRGRGGSAGKTAVQQDTGGSVSQTPATSSGGGGKQAGSRRSKN